ncbi:MAG: transglycosylase domain-containing protein [Bacteroidales bacterium]
MKDKNKKYLNRALWIVFLAPIVLLILALIIVGSFTKIPSFKELENPESNLATELISSDGEIINTYHIENRVFVRYEDLSPYLLDAVLSTEDVRFYNHTGIDFKSLIRVGVKSLLLGNTSSGGGGSTITQQLAKTLFPRDTSRINFPGGSKIKLIKNKFREWITAVKLERNYTKDEILTMYLNVIFFGSNAYGIKSAANTFFDKEPWELNIQESASLVGMVNKPTRFNPVLHYENSIKRRNHVLRQMAKYDFISEQVCDSILNLPIDLHYEVQDHNSGLAPYFRDMIRRVMNEHKPKKKNYYFGDDYRRDLKLWEEDALYGWLNKNLKPDGTKYNLDRDGLKIYTTINSKMQKYAEEAVEEHLGTQLQKDFFTDMAEKENKPFAVDVAEEQTEVLMAQARKWSDRYYRLNLAGADTIEIKAAFEKQYEMRVFSWNKAGYIDTIMSPNDSIRYYKSFLRAAFIAMEAHTGNVLAYVGGPNYRYFKYDNASQSKRQVGSTIKPFLYTLAMQEGCSPCDEVMNVPQTFIVGDTTWTPQSTDRAEWMGRIVTLKWGLTHSSNNISAYLMKRFGPKAMVEMCRKMGISSYLPAVPSLCVGPADIRVQEMVSAINTFPSQGVHVEPVFISKITDKQGNVISHFASRQHEAISAKTAYLMVNLMENVVNHGTGGRLRWKYGFKGEIAGKTGTTNNQADGWFIGYTPKFTAGVWVGAEDRQIHFESLHFGSGSNMALPIWALFYKKVIEDGSLGISPEDKFMAPPGIKMNLDCTVVPPPKEGETEVKKPRKDNLEETYF